MGLTEGWKWRKDSGRPDNHSLITHTIYHFWRAVTNGSWIALAVLMALIKENISHVLITFAFANGAAWILYERLISFIQFDKFMEKREKFHIFGISIKRINSELEVSIGIFFFILLVLNLFIFH